MQVFGKLTPVHSNEVSIQVKPEHRLKGQRMEARLLLNDGNHYFEGPLYITKGNLINTLKSPGKQISKWISACDRSEEDVRGRANQRNTVYFFRDRERRINLHFYELSRNGESEMVAVSSPHIELDDRGRPWIAGTKVKVIEVVLDHTAYGFSPAEIHLQHPHLSLAQIHAALSYYYDHQAEIDAEIQRQNADAERLWEQNRDSPGRRRLREKGLLP